VNSAELRCVEAALHATWRERKTGAYQIIGRGRVNYSAWNNSQSCLPWAIMSAAFVSHELNQPLSQLKTYFGGGALLICCAIGCEAMFRCNLSGVIDDLDRTYGGSSRG